VWLVRTATVMPDNERWLHQPDAAADLKSALTWAQENPPDDTNLIEALEQLRG
jgi:hypothetical protein